MHRTALTLAFALAGQAGAAPRSLPLGAAPPPVQEVVRAERGLAGLRVDALTVEERDLDHDGRPEWLVTASATDGAGLHIVNRPVWLFRQEDGAWRLLGFLGFQLKVEPAGAAAAGGWDELRAISKDGARQRCARFRWARDHYQREGCCDPATGAARSCR